MPSAGLMEMPPVSKVTPLPTKSEMIASSASSRDGMHDNEERRIDAALRDAQQRAHPELAPCVLIEHFVTRGRDRAAVSPGSVGEFLGRQLIGRLVD